MFVLIQWRFRMNCIPGEKLNQNWRETILIGVSERDIFRLSAAISKERFSIDKTESYPVNVIVGIRTELKEFGNLLQLSSGRVFLEKKRLKPLRVPSVKLAFIDITSLLNRY